MYTKWLGLCGMLALLFVMPRIAVAQDYPEERSGEIQVINDVKRAVRITLVTTRGEPFGPRTWTLAPGQHEFLGNAAGRRIRVRGSDRISIGRGEQVDIAQVGHFEQGIWYVSTREMWRITHPRPGLPPDQERAMPPEPGSGLPPDAPSDLPPGAPPEAPPGAPSERQRY